MLIKGALVSRGEFIGTSISARRRLDIALNGALIAGMACMHWA